MSSERRLAIEAVGLRKEYRLGELPDIRRLLKLRGGGESPRGNVLTVLRALDLEVPVGECLGILGTNGSGKSTLVQMISAISEPTGGVLRVRGRVLPLLEVGAGFNDELTGRENVTLFGTILGLRREEIEGALPEIVQFGGIDHLHMDTPLKRYSTGMRARLSFAVAIRFPADIYIFDEVIAVVDDQFREFALAEIEELRKAGRTILFISHDLDVVRRVCTIGLWLDRGEARGFGAIDEVADAYAAFRAATADDTAAETAASTSPA